MTIAKIRDYYRTAFVLLLMTVALADNLCSAIAISGRWNEPWFRISAFNWTASVGWTQPGWTTMSVVKGSAINLRGLDKEVDWMGVATWSDKSCTEIWVPQWLTAIIFAGSTALCCLHFRRVKHRRGFDLS